MAVSISEVLAEIPYNSFNYKYTRRDLTKLLKKYDDEPKWDFVKDPTSTLDKIEELYMVLDYIKDDPKSPRDKDIAQDYLYTCEALIHEFPWEEEAEELERQRLEGGE